jgi:alkylation response protein AidB-like acyl-CoA dehydrogenase
VSATASDLLAAVAAAEPVVRANADRAEQERTLPRETVDALIDTGIMRAFVPEAYGGACYDPPTVLEALMRLGAADGSAGWCAMIAATTSTIAATLDPDAARMVYGDPRSVSGGAFAPQGRATATDGGYEVDGRWQWGSGTRHCDWILGGALTDTGDFRLCFVPAGRVTMHDTWFTSGLRGTGSGDFSFDRLVVPEGFTTRAVGAKRRAESLVARFPNFTLLASGVASVLVGIAQRAVDEIVALAQGKVPMYASKTLATQQISQIEVGQAMAAVGAARRFLVGEVADAWDTVCRGDRVDLDTRVRIRLACSHAAAEAIRTTDLAYHLGGGSSVFSDNPLQRCFRDVHTGSQHVMVGRRILETVGRHVMGQEADTAML